MSIVHFPAEIMETSRSEGKLDGSRFNLREVENLVNKLQETFVVRVYDVIISASSLSAMRCEKPTIAFSGVRIS